VSTQGKFTILLAEDNPGDIFLIRRALDAENLPYELLSARDGQQAIELLEQAARGDKKINMILIDLNLPKHDGGEVLLKLRNLEPAVSVPTVVMTSSDSPKDRARCEQLGVTHYFQKPSDLKSYMEIGRIIKGLLPAD
jgi:CheY-like chemotaxis protein